MLSRGGCGVSVTGVEEHVLCSLVLPWAMCLTNSRMSVKSPSVHKQMQDLTLDQTLDSVEQSSGISVLSSFFLFSGLLKCCAFALN